ncbi:MAG: hypothetical protein H0T42_25910 [Deltaproteobacteria bacterium]|nr:hypothetical protein [Deltaproteobacteria bacterium]
MRGQTAVSIHANDAALIGDADSAPLPPSIEINLDVPDCAAFDEDTRLRVAGRTVPLANATDESFGCTQAQGRATFPVGVFSGQPVTIELEDSTDLWTVKFDGFSNDALEFPTQLTVGQVAKMTWTGAPHVDNGCYRLTGPNEGFDPHGCKFDDGIRFPPVTAADTVELDITVFWPQQAEVLLSMVAEYGGLGPPPLRCDGPASCGVLLNVNRTFAVTVAR